MLSGVSDLLLAAVAVMVAGVGAVAAAVIVTWLRLRRRWRALRSSTALRIGVSLLGVVRSGGPWGSGRRDAPALLRLQLWQSVDGATRAVQAAERSAGALGDLPSLCRRLRAASEELDQLLVLADGSPGARSTASAAGLLAQVAEVRDAATAIRTAALASAGDAAAMRMGPLADDARREVESVTAGVARAGQLLGRQRPVA